ncbi:unnamed protein product, partial [Hapterophycus canaliculatus]
MIPHDSSTHVRVGLVLTQVRGEFLRASPSDPEGSSRAIKALEKAFELLNCCDSCYRCRTPPNPAPGGRYCCRYIEEKEIRLNEEAIEADGDKGGARADVDEESTAFSDRIALRNAFLEASYIPFASLLLREVGPTWLSLWDLKSTPTSSRTPRDMFEAFLRPPAVPPSLALLGLCEGLRRQAPESTTTSTQLVSAQQLQSDSSPGGGAGMIVGANPTPDARGVQLVCRLLEPYLREPSTLQTQTTTTNSDEVPLLVRAVRELAGSAEGYGGDDRVHGGNGNVALRAGEDGEGGRQCGVDVDFIPPPFVGGDAAETLASALCLAPQRVANSLGPIAPPIFSPAEFFPTVCRAAVSAVLAPWKSERATMRAATGATTAVTGAIPAAVAGDVWREFTGRLLTAGRAPDLADAWLGAMVTGSQRERGDKAERYEPADTGIDGAPNAAAAAMEEAEAAAWEAWAETPGGSPEAHAWMMTRLPESRRKTLTEALLRALWPADGRGRHLARRGKQGTQGQPSRRWPPGFPTAACRVLIGRPLLPGKRLPMLRGEGNGERRAGEEMGRAGSGVGVASVFPIGRRQQTRFSEDDHAGRGGGGAEEAEEAAEGAAIDASVGLVERLLLQRPLPGPAAEAIADTLAWCDRRSSRAASRLGAVSEGGDSRAGSGHRRLLIGALNRVAAVWAEPSFLNRSPKRQQEFYTRFLLAALRGGGLDGQLGGTDGNQEAFVLLIRGVGSHLDIPSRETRLRGMRVGEAVAALSGQDLRFDELDGEREQRGKQ